MKNNIAPPIPAELLQGDRMVKIRSYDEVTLVYTALEVSEDIYKILQDKVIKNLTSNIDLQIFLQANKITLDKYMYACITNKMVTEAVNEI